MERIIKAEYAKDLQCEARTATRILDYLECISRDEAPQTLVSWIWTAWSEYLVGVEADDSIICAVGVVDAIGEDLSERDELDLAVAKILWSLASGQDPAIWLDALHEIASLLLEEAV